MATGKLSFSQYKDLTEEDKQSILDEMDKVIGEKMQDKFHRETDSSNPFQVIKNIYNFITNTAQNMMDSLYGEFIYILNEDLIKNIEIRKNLEKYLQDLELEIAELSQKYYYRLVNNEAFETYMKNTLRSVQPNNDKFSYDIMYNFLFEKKVFHFIVFEEDETIKDTSKMVLNKEYKNKTYIGNKIARKIHEYYVIYYYILMYGKHNNPDDLSVIYDDSIIPLYFYDRDTPTNTMHILDRKKFDTFKFNILSFFAQALCYKDLEKKGIDLLLNHFRDVHSMEEEEPEEKSKEKSKLEHTTKKSKIDKTDEEYSKQIRKIQRTYKKSIDTTKMKSELYQTKVEYNKKILQKLIKTLCIDNGDINISRVPSYVRPGKYTSATERPDEFKLSILQGDYKPEFKMGFYTPKPKKNKTKKRVTAKLGKMYEKYKSSVLKPRSELFSRIMGGKTRRRRSQ